jgi:predicted nucleic acid-binding Zn ribbon protein
MRATIAEVESDACSTPPSNRRHDWVLVTPHCCVCLRVIPSPTHWCSEDCAKQISFELPLARAVQDRLKQALSIERNSTNNGT